LPTQQQLLDGYVFFVNKPLDWTSFNIVAKIRNTARIKKVGHAGTLDPLATGVLIVCTGKFTKKINEYMGMEKEYTGTITLGATTPSFDLETAPENFLPFDYVSENLINEKLKDFTGEISQIPPKFSAIKIGGKTAYKLARKGEEVELKSRTVTIKVFEITKIDLPVLHFRIVCTTGTYIRSIANDFGAALGCGGYLSSLCRTRIGDFSITACKEVHDIVEEINKAKEIIPN
jgi:tRNA pseudouridine55 synthase